MLADLAAEEAAAAAEAGSGGKAAVGGDEGKDDATLLAEEEARETKKKERVGREIRSIGDLGLAHVLDGRETLLDELRYQVGRGAWGGAG